MRSILRALGSRISMSTMPLKSQQTIRECLKTALGSEPCEFKSEAGHIHEGSFLPLGSGLKEAVTLAFAIMGVSRSRSTSRKLSFIFSVPLQA